MNTISELAVFRIQNTFVFRKYIAAGKSSTYSYYIDRAIFVYNPFYLLFVSDPVPRIYDFIYPGSHSHSRDYLLIDYIKCKL